MEESNNYTVYTTLKRKRDKKLNLLLSIGWNDLYFIVPIFLITLIPTVNNIINNHIAVLNTMYFFIICNVISLLLAQEYKRIKIYSYIWVIFKYYFLETKIYNKKTKLTFVLTKINTKWGDNNG